MAAAVGTLKTEVNLRDKGEQGRCGLLSMLATLLAKSGSNERMVAPVCLVHSRARLPAGTLALKATHCRKNGGVILMKLLLFNLHSTCTGLHGIDQV